MCVDTNTHTTAPPRLWQGQSSLPPMRVGHRLRVAKAFSAEGLAEALTLARREECLGWAMKELHAVSHGEGGKGQAAMKGSGCNSLMITVTRTEGQWSGRGHGELTSHLLLAFVAHGSGDFRGHRQSRVLGDSCT